MMEGYVPAKLKQKHTRGWAQKKTIHYRPRTGPDCCGPGCRSTRKKSKKRRSVHVVKLPSGR